MTMMGLARTARNITISDDPVHKSVVDACRNNPFMVAGKDRATTKFMESTPGLFIKDGAEGVGFSSMPDGRAVVFKIGDGSNRAFGVILQGAWRQLGVELPNESSDIRYVN